MAIDPAAASRRMRELAALAPVITEAGGVITDWRGDALSYGGGIDTVLASGDPNLHAKALEILEF